MAEAAQSFTLQYGEQTTTCSAITTWTDVGAPGSATVWRGFDASPTDGTQLPSTLLTVSDVAGVYTEANDTVPNPAAVAVNEDIEYDWILQHNGAEQRTNYCFRMVNSDDTVLSEYEHYPTLRTTGYTPVVNDWRWYDDENNETPVADLGGENVTPSDVALNDVVVLRVNLEELENAAGDNVQLYVEHQNFPTSVMAGQSCVQLLLVTLLVCAFSNGVANDGDTISTAVLSSTDTCSGGTGVGWGTQIEPAQPQWESVTKHWQPKSSHSRLDTTVRE